MLAVLAMQQLTTRVLYDWYIKVRGICLQEVLALQELTISVNTFSDWIFSAFPLQQVLHDWYIHGKVHVKDILLLIRVCL